MRRTKNLGKDSRLSRNKNSRVSGFSRASLFKISTGSRYAGNARAFRVLRSTKICQRGSTATSSGLETARKKGGKRSRAFRSRAEVLRSFPRLPKRLTVFSFFSFFFSFFSFVLQKRSLGSEKFSNSRGSFSRSVNSVLERSMFS